MHKAKRLCVQRLTRTQLETVLDGARIVADACKIERVLLCLKDHNAKTFGFADGDTLSYGVTVRVLPDVYPLGDEINLIYESTGRLVQPGCLPLTQGVWSAPSSCSTCHTRDNDLPTWASRSHTRCKRMLSSLLP